MLRLTSVYEHRLRLPKSAMCSYPSLSRTNSTSAKPLTLAQHISTDGDTLEHLWGENTLRIFLSHTAEYKTIATEVKDHLKDYGITCFVAHEDIQPLQEWQSEIEVALFTMDALIALLTEGFRGSDWTDQEIGVAVGRQVPIFPIRLGEDPYGFIGKYQALQGAGKTSMAIGDEILGHVMQNDELMERYKDAYITAVSTSLSFNRSNSLANLLPQLENLSPVQIESLVGAYNTNYEVRHSFGFRGKIIDQLHRLSGDEYVFGDNGILRMSEHQVTPDDLPF